MNVRVLAAGITTSAALLITACGGGAEQPPAHEPPAHDQHSQHGQQGQHGEAEFNEADVAFARNMVPHHEQAVRMSEQVPSRTEQPQVRELASRIGSAQRPEIERMNGWLQDWHAGPDQQGQHGDHQMPGQHGDHQAPGGHQMHGMMGPEQMADLERARGSDFDRRWVQMMVEHHRGAVEMARAEQDRGRNPEAKQLAGQMVDSQRAEIDEMNALLPRL